MKLFVNIILFGSLFAQSIDNEASEAFIESLLDDLNRERNNFVIKRIVIRSPIIKITKKKNRMKIKWTEIRNFLFTRSLII